MPKGKENAGFMKMVSAERVHKVCSVLKVINALKDTLLRNASNTWITPVSMELTVSINNLKTPFPLNPFLRSINRLPSSMETRINISPRKLAQVQMSLHNPLPTSLPPLTTCPHSPTNPAGSISSISVIDMISSSTTGKMWWTDYGGNLNLCKRWRKAICYENKWRFG